MAGHTLSFRMVPEVRTLVFDKNERETREAQKIIVVNTAGIDITVTIEWTRSQYPYLGSTFFITKDRPVGAADSRIADLTAIFFREDDLLYVTVSGTADILVHLEED